MTGKQYLLMAYQEATKSPDPSTQNGAVVVSAGAAGTTVADHNRFPEKVELTRERLERPLKYEFIEHAERNVIYKCARLGIPTHGATMYVPWFACSDCARAIIQAGIAHVVGHQRMADETPDRWRDSIGTAMTMLEEAGVRITMIHDVLDGPKILFNERWWTP
jgi:dCMP deaminase